MAEVCRCKRKRSRGKRDRGYGHDEASGQNAPNGDQVMIRSKSQGGVLTEVIAKPVSKTRDKEDGASERKTLRMSVAAVATGS